MTNNVLVMLLWCSTFNDVLNPQKRLFVTVKIIHTKFRWRIFSISIRMIWSREIIRGIELMTNLTEDKHTASTLYWATSLFAVIETVANICDGVNVCGIYSSNSILSRIKHNCLLFVSLSFHCAVQCNRFVLYDTERRNNLKTTIDKL